jgi:hypothetical protein
MGARPLAVDSRCVESILIYCRPRGSARADTLRAWLEHQAADLAARPGVRRAVVVHLSTPAPDSRRHLGWVVECEIPDAGDASAGSLRELLTDMRLVGLAPVVFVAQPQAV